MNNTFNFSVIPSITESKIGEICISNSDYDWIYLKQIINNHALMVLVLFVIILFSIKHLLSSFNYENKSIHTMIDFFILYTFIFILKIYTDLSFFVELGLNIIFLGGLVSRLIHEYMKGDLPFLKK
jgi:hypothetical protein